MTHLLTRINHDKPNFPQENQKNIEQHHKKTILDLEYGGYQCQFISYLRLNDYLPFFVLLVWPRETWCGFRFMWFISSTKLNRSKMVLSTIHNLGFFKNG